MATRRNRPRTLAALAAAGALTFSLAPAAHAGDYHADKHHGDDHHYGWGPTAVALTTTNRLVSFDTYAMWKAHHDVAVTGLAEGEVLIGIDRRPLDQVIYGIARSPEATRLYAIDAPSGHATWVADLTSPTGEAVVLLGHEFGVDFNPAADAIRIVSDGGQNLRVLPTARTVEEVPRPAGTTFTDGTLREDGFAATGITAAAYPANDTDPDTPTTLYVLDGHRGRVLVQDPPNDGVLDEHVTVQARTASAAGFDILTLDGVDYAYLTVGHDDWGRTRLVKLDLSSGWVHELGKVPTDAPVRGIAL